MMHPNKGKHVDRDTPHNCGCEKSIFFMNINGIKMTKVVFTPHVLVFLWPNSHNIRDIVFSILPSYKIRSKSINFIRLNRRNSYISSQHFGTGD